MLRLVILLLVGTTVTACGSNSDGGADTGFGSDAPTVATVPVQGGGVKGPWREAGVTVSVIDPADLELEGRIVATGNTGADTRIRDLLIPDDITGIHLLAVQANAATVDVTRDAPPALQRMVTALSGEQLRGGDVYATPLSTVAVKLAALLGDDDTPPLRGNGDASLSEEEFEAALPVASARVAVTLGMGLEGTYDLYAGVPVLTDKLTDEAALGAAVRYRQAVEGLGALLEHLHNDAMTANPGTPTTQDSLLDALALDLVDGSIDGKDGGQPIAGYADIPDLVGVMTVDASALLVPGTSIPLTEIETLMVDETVFTGATLDTTRLSDGSVVASPQNIALVADSDADGVPDGLDDLPLDPSEQEDTDGDGIGNNADEDDDGDGFPDRVDAFPLDATERLDSDEDGVGNNADEDDDNDGVPDASDAFPLDPLESEDTDGDGIGNVVDGDDDGDGVNDAEDAFPLDVYEARDSDGDGVGDNADTDDDGDGVDDVDDGMPRNPAVTVAVTVAIGAGGGTLVSPDGALAITLPENALPATENVTVGLLSGSALAATFGADSTVEAAYVVEPALQLAAPAQLVWNIPEGTSPRVAPRLVATMDGEEIDYLAARVETDAAARRVTTVIDHLGTFVIENMTFEMQVTDAEAFPNPLRWEYGLAVPPPAGFKGTIVTEGFDADGQQVADPQVLDVLTGDTYIDQLAYTFPLVVVDGLDRSESQPAADARCLDSTEDGLPGRIRLGVDFTSTAWRSTVDGTGFSPLTAARGRLQLEADAVCRDSSLITSAIEISIGPGVDRINAAGAPPYTEIACQDPLLVVPAQDKVVYFAADGRCRETQAFNGGGLANFGGVLLQDAGVERVLLHSQFGTTVGVPETGFLQRSFGGVFSGPTTDAVNGVADDGAVDFRVAYAVTDGLVHRYRPDATETAQRELVFDSTAINGSPIVSYAPIAPGHGLGVSNAVPSRLWLFDEAGGTAELLGDVGSGALKIVCARLRDAMAGCAVAAYGSKEIYAVTGSPGAFKIHAPLANASTASPAVRVTGAGHLVIGHVNDDNDLVRLAGVDPAGFGIGPQFEFHFTDLIAVEPLVGFSLHFIEDDAAFGSGVGIAVSAGDIDGVDGKVLVFPGDESLFGSGAGTFWFQ